MTTPTSSAGLGVTDRVILETLNEILDTLRRIADHLQLIGDVLSETHQ